MRRFTPLVAAVSVAGLVAATAPRLIGASPDLIDPTLTGSLAVAPPAIAPAAAQVSDGFEVVGHSSLDMRGMNAAIAVHDGYVYVGSRTDAQPQHLRPGILVVDATDPTAPTIVHEIGQPHAANIGETTRELRIWPQQDVLVVLTFGCSEIIHACVGGTVTGPRWDFYDIAGDNAAAPVHLASHTPSRTPHEFFLWVDPHAPDERALLFWTAPTTSSSAPSLVVTDISSVRDGAVGEIAEWRAQFSTPGDRRLHSLTLTNDGSRAHLAFLGAGYLALDTSAVAAGEPNPVIDLVVEPQDRVWWSDPGAHSAYKVPARDVVLITDEVYGDALDPVTGQDHGCPWGWVRVIDIADETLPELVGEYRVEENQPSYCDDPVGGSPANTMSTSFASHNPTMTPDLAFITWHSAGLEAIDIADPANPVRVGKFKPDPLPVVVTEDPALSLGLDKVVMWSFPVIEDGLIYALDLRNGLYILRYTGPGSDDIDAIEFLEGNSNLGDALRYEPVPDPEDESS